MTGGSRKMPMRLLVVMPTWLGDSVMATPALGLLREGLPGAFIGALVRPGIDEILAGSGFFDEVHVEPRAGMMGPKRSAGKIRPMRYDTALLLTNSFSSALATRLAFIPRRVGYERDSRGMLLTEKLSPERRRNVEPYSRSATSPGAWAPVTACDSYLRLVRLILGNQSLPMGKMGLSTTEREEHEADAALESMGLDPDLKNAVVLNPGGNNEAKRWPEDRFTALGAWLREEMGATVLVSGSPGEAGLVGRIAEGAGGVSLAEARGGAGVRIGSLKAIVKRCMLMVTNDTGPRHIAAAFGVPVVTLFGPTDRRWTTIPFEKEIELDADPGLPEEEVSNDHPGRCLVERITLERVKAAARELMDG